MRRRYSGYENNTKTGCTTLLVLLLLNLALGSWSVNEILSWFGKDIPTIADVVIGLFAGQVSIPIAIVGKILIACGVF